MSVKNLEGLQPPLLGNDEGSAALQGKS